MDNIISHSATGITFDVSDVITATAPVREVNVRTATERAIGSKVESCGNYSGNAVDCYPVHGLFAAVGQAFNDHRPLVLSPDIVWLTIVQGLSAHINLAPEKHRGQFVSHQGQKTIQVRRDDFVQGALDNPWNEVFTEFGLHIREDIGHELYQLIVSNFSTTGVVERAASEIALMSTVKAFFQFEVQSMCGIPRVTLEGTISDWVELSKRIDQLQNFAALDFWLPALKRIVDQFVATASGDISKAFWIDMYKVDDMSGGPYINGWLSHLIPYIDGGTRINPCLNGGKITEPQLPTSISTVPFQWNLRGVKYNYEFLAGLITVQQNSQTLALRPTVGWAVRTVEQGELSVTGRRRDEDARYKVFDARRVAPTPQPKSIFTFPDGLGREHYEDAIVSLSKSIAENPKHFLYVLKRGSAFAHLEHFEYALADFDFVIQVNPDLAVTYAERAKVYRALGRVEEAERDSMTANRLGYVG